jgi:hypothetical protein
MKLTRILLDNVRGAPSGEHALTHPTTGAPLDTVYVTGPASSGKTTFLEAIAALKESVGAYGYPPDPARLLRRGALRGRIEGTWLLTPEEAQVAEVREPTITTSLDLGPDVPPSLADAGIRTIFERYSHDPTEGKFEYFPSDRRLGPGEGALPPSPSLEASTRLRKGPEKFGFLRRALVDLALRDGIETVREATERGILFKSDTRDSLAPYRLKMAALAPEVRLVGVDASGHRPEIVFEKRDGARLTLAELSDGEQQAFLFAATFQWLGLSRSVVLVDQPELSIHADAQLDFARALTRMGEGNQVFFATGSREVVRTAAPHEIIDLGKRP